MGKYKLKPLRDITSYPQSRRYARKWKATSVGEDVEELNIAGGDIKRCKHLEKLPNCFPQSETVNLPPRSFTPRSLTKVLKTGT